MPLHFPFLSSVAGFFRICRLFLACFDFSLSKRLFLGVLGHGVQGAAVLEPVDLAGVEGVRQGDLENGAVLGVDAQSQGLANSQLGGQDVDLNV